MMHFTILVFVCFHVYLVCSQQVLQDRPIANFLNCFQCCAAADNAFNAEIKILACQEGCQNNVNAINSEDEIEQASFDVGKAFAEKGQADIVSVDQTVTLFCSAAADFEIVLKDANGNAQEVVNGVCQQCCTELNGQFDNQIDDAYSVAKCQSPGCDDNFENISCADEAELRDQLGCELGQFFRKDGGVTFRDLGHVCTAGGDNLKTFGATLVTTCETCCDLAAAQIKGDLDLTACRDEGCGAVQVCAESVRDIDSCNAGRDFLLEGTATLNGNKLQCLFDNANTGVATLEVFVEFENNDLEVAELALITVGSTVGVGLIGAAVLFLRRRRRNNSMEISGQKLGTEPSGLGPPAPVYGSKPPTQGGSEYNSYAADSYGGSDYRRRNDYY